jgi:hypothetical protein
MEKISSHFINELNRARVQLQSADHLVYVTLPVVKDFKLIIRALECLYKGVVVNISLILKYEYLYKRVILSRDNKKNLNIFFNKCGVRYGLSDEGLLLLKELILFGRKHKESGLEFSKNGKFAIVDDDLKFVVLDEKKIKEFIGISKVLLEKTNGKFQGNF